MPWSRQKRQIMSNAYSSLYAKGTVEVIATNVITGDIVKKQTINNTIVRNGRVALAKLITGEAAMDKSYIVLETTFPRTYVPVPTISDGWLGLLNSGVPTLYYLGPLYTSNPVVNQSIGSVTRDISGFVTYLNQIFTLYSTHIGQDIPIYKADGTVGATFAHTSPALVASIVIVGSEQRVKIEARDSGTGPILPYSTIDTTQQVLFYTDDSLFGNYTAHTSTGIAISESDYVVTGLQLGVSNGTTSITDSGFAPDTYVSPRYVPAVSYGQADPDGLYDTQAKFKVIIPASEGNGESGTGVTYTEAALLCRNDSWFTHVHFGQFFKSNQIQLTINWTVDFMP